MKFKHTPQLILALCLTLATAPLPTIAQPAAQAAASDPYAALVKREFGTAVDEMMAIDKQIQYAKPEEFPLIEARLIAVIEAPEATMAGKQFACRMLRLVGSPKCVPAVGKLLTDGKLSHMARNVLLGMSDSSADKALREALGKTQGQMRIGIINTIGDRGDSGAVASLGALLDNADADTMEASLEALGKIGDAKAADALDKAKVPDNSKTMWAQAYLRCATNLTAKGEAARAQKMVQTLLDGKYASSVRAGALREIVFAQKEKAVPMIVQTLGSDDKIMMRAALSAVIAVPGKAATAAFAPQLAAQNSDGKVVLLGALASRGDGAGLTTLVNKLAADNDAAVREAALSALGQIGDGSSVPVLVSALKDNANNAIAMRSLADLRGEGVAQSLINQVQDGDASLRASLLGVLADRKQIEALPVARKIINNDDAKMRESAVKVLSALGMQEDLQGLSDAILTTKNDGERANMARALITIGNRLSDKGKRDDSVMQSFAKADAPTKVQLLPVLLAFAGDKSLQATRGALAEPGEVHKAAVKALAQWPDAAPLADLRGIAKDDGDNTVRILALRGLIPMIGNSRLKTEEKVQSLREALELSTRPEEKRQVLGEIGKVGHVDSLKIVEPFLNDKDLKNEALQAYERIAESLVDRQPAIAKDALQKVLDSTTDNGLKEKAQAAMRRVK